MARLNRAAKGARVERKAVAMLRGLGFSVTRSAASLGAWDLVAVDSLRLMLVQVRANRWPSRAEMERLRAFRCPPGTVREVWRWDDFAKAPLVRRL